jgi:Methyltransferase domain
VRENLPVPTEGPIGLLRDADRQMSFGERAGLEGLLAQARPRLAIEIGTAEGGTLERLAHYSQQVLALDLDCSVARERRLANVTFHEGDSHILLPELLSGLTEEARNVDFALVDGDHSSEGVRLDVTALLDSPATTSSLIVIHDTSNELVRAGLERIPFEAYPKVAHVDLDFLPGYVFREPSLRHELWGGLGLVVVDSARAAYFAGPVRQRRYYESFALLREARDALATREADGGRPARRSAGLRFPLLPGDSERLRVELESTRADLAHTREELTRLSFWHREVTGSLSWRLTAPLRGLLRLVRRVRRPSSSPSP